MIWSGRFWDDAPGKLLGSNKTIVYNCPQLLVPSFTVCVCGASKLEAGAGF